MKRIPTPQGDPLITVMQLEEITKTLAELNRKLDELGTILARIESRQIKTTEMVAEVKEHEQPVTGSFATGYQKQE
jgi:hypothetical protein